MNNEDISTYTNGYSLRITREIKKGDIVRLCALLDERFQSEFGGSWKLEPEPITEGGIKFVQWPSNLYGEGGYKSMRLGQRKGNKWPYVSDNAIEAWSREADDIVYDKPRTIIYRGKEKEVLPDNNVISTFLKAFYGAPAWTIKELQIFEECMSEIGLVRKGIYPTKKSLVE